MKFLRASRLGFRKLISKQDKYQEIRFTSTVGMHGFLSFLAPDTLDATLYNKLSIEIALTNFPNPSSRVNFTRTIVPGGSNFADTYDFTFVPDEATCVANAQLFFGLGPAVTTKTATLIQHTFKNSTGGTIGTQRFELSEPIDIRVWQHLMVDNLAKRQDIETQQADDIAAGLYTLEDTWDTLWFISGDGSYFSEPGAKTRLFTYPGVPALVSDNPPTGNLPPLAGKILQILRGTNTTGDAVLQDILGIEGAHYYPGLHLDNRLYVWADNDPTGTSDDVRMLGMIPSYHQPDLIYLTFETLTCSETRHRIHQSPVYLKIDIRDVLGFGQYGPDIGGYPRTSTENLGYPIDASGRIEFDVGCPANVVADYFGLYPDYYAVTSIFELFPATNINGFVIPP